jgi:hypothetical protein
MKVLYSAGDLRDAIQEILAAPEPGDRRVVLVAFVGGKAEAFLPAPRGMEIVCWLQPGSTDALTLERLQKRGAKLFKSERLHMKVYWSSRRGCVVCSANASGQALGGGDQKEAGVRLQPGAVNIERLWEEAKPNPVEGDDLKKLARENDRIIRNGARGDAATPADFREWRSLSHPRDWKLGSWTDDAEFAQDAVDLAHRTYGVSAPHYLFNTKKGQVRPRDWLLTFKWPHISNASWLYVDFVVKVRPADKAAYFKDYSFQAVQVHKPDRYRPPFQIDSAFRAALKRAVGKFGVEKLEAPNSLTPPNRLLDLIGAGLDAI